MFYSVNVSALLVFFLFLTAIPSSVTAQVDREEQAWLQTLDLPLYWDNIHRPPQCESKKQAEPDRREGYRAYALQASDFVDIRVPAGSWLRLNSLDVPLVDADYQVYRSLDGTMFTPVLMQRDTLGRSAISGEPAAQLSRYRVIRRTANGENATIAFFLSRSPQVPVHPSYHHTHPLETGGRKVRFSDTPGSEEYWYLRAGEEAGISVEGPLRIRLISRVEVSPSTNSPHERYQLQTSIDGIKGQTFYNESADETFQEVMVDGCVASVARARNNAFSIPKGRHLIRITPSRSLYLQIVSEKYGRDYLLRGNWPVKALAEAAGMPDTPFWQLPLSLSLSSESFDLAQREQIGQRLAIDNSLQPTALLAAELLKTGIPSAGPSYQQKLALRREKSSTFFSDILPMNGGPLDVRPLTVLRWYLDEAVIPPLLQKSKLSDLAEKKSRIRFTALAKAPEKVLRYHLPPSRVPATLRITAWNTQPADEGIIHMQVDDLPPVRILLSRQDAGRQEKLTPEKKWLAASMQQNRQQRWPDDALALPWGLLNVPASAKVVRFWGEEDILLALEIQKSATYRPGDLAYRAGIEALGRERARQRFFAHLQGLDSSVMPAVTPEKETLLNELDNQWLPLLRFFAGEQRFYSRKAYVPDEAEEAALPADELQQYLQRAEEEQGKGNLIAAIEFVSYGIRGLRGEEQLRARMQRAELLVEHGEVWLASREFWLIHSQSTNETLREGALTRLVQVARENNNEEQVVRILSSALIERSEPERMARLIVSLVTSGSYRSGLELSALLPDELLPLAHVLQAAMEEGWWESFDICLGLLQTDELRAYWLGWKALKNLEIDAALSSWQQAGSAGEKEIVLLREALAIRVLLADGEQEKRVEGIHRWEAWQESQSYRARWALANRQVTSYSMAEIVQYPDLGVSLTQYRVPPGQPLQMELYGPAKLRISVRPLHDDQNILPLDDWLLITGSHGVMRYPIVGNMVDESKRVAADLSSRVGQRDRFVIEIPAGQQTISMALRDRDALMSFEILEAREYISLLPPLTAQLAARCLKAAMPLEDAPEYSRRVRLIDQCRKKMFSIPLAAGSPVIAAGTADPVPTMQRQTAVQADSEAARVNQLADFLWKVENEEASVSTVFAKAAEYGQEKYSSSLVRQVLQRLQRAYQWQEVTNLYQRAGVRDVLLGEMLEESPENRIREALLPPLNEGAVRIRSFNGLLFSVEQPFEREFLFKLSPEALLDLPAKTLHVGMTFNDEKERIIELVPGKKAQRVKHLIRAGSHAIRFRIIDPVARHSVRIQAYEKSEDKWSVFAMKSGTRRYHVADRSTPLTVYVEGPGLVRIDEWERGTVLSRYRVVDSGWNRLEIEPSSGKTESLYRVHQMIPEAFKESLPVMLPESALKPLPTAVGSGERKGQDTVALESMIQTDGATGTVSFSANMVSRRYVDDDVDDAGDREWGDIRRGILDAMGNENFVGFTLDYRSYLESSRVYQKSSAFMRVREFGDPTLGASTRWVIPTLWPQMIWKNISNMYVQRPDTDSDTEWLIDFRTELSQQRTIGQNVRHRPLISLFARAMSLDSYQDGLDGDSGYADEIRSIDAQLSGEATEEAMALLDRENLRALDSDIFSNYKRDHLYGMKIEDVLTYNPFRDLSCWVAASVVSNEDFNVFQPDYVSATVGARIYFQDWDVSLHYDVKEYFSDDDRDTDLTREKIGVKLNYRTWQTAARGYSLGLRVEHDKSSGDNSGWLTVSLHRSSYRMMKDFIPGEISFKDLRQRRALEENYLRQDGLER